MCPVPDNKKANHRLDLAAKPKDTCKAQGALTPFGAMTANAALLSKNAYSEAGKITCESQDTLDIKIYDADNAQISMTYNLRTYQYACIPDDQIHLIFEFAKKEFFEGKDMCFDNKPYLSSTDSPFVVNNNCYATGKSTQDFFKCHTQGYKVVLHVLDHKDANIEEKRPWPIRLPQMYLKVSFDTVKNFFQIFPDDKVKVSLYLEGQSNPKSIVVSPKDAVTPVCEPTRVSD